MHQIQPCKLDKCGSLLLEGFMCHVVAPVKSLWGLFLDESSTPLRCRILSRATFSFQFLVTDIMYPGQWSSCCLTVACYSQGIKELSVNALNAGWVSHRGESSCSLQDSGCGWSQNLWCLPCCTWQVLPLSLLLMADPHMCAFSIPCHLSSIIVSECCSVASSISSLFSLQEKWLWNGGCIYVVQWPRNGQSRLIGRVQSSTKLLCSLVKYQQ